MALESVVLEVLELLGVREVSLSPGSSRIPDPSGP